MLITNLISYFRYIITISRLWVEIESDRGLKWDIFYTRPLTILITNLNLILDFQSVAPNCT